MLFTDGVGGYLVALVAPNKAMSADYEIVCAGVFAVLDRREAGACDLVYAADMAKSRKLLVGKFIGL